MFSRTLTKSFKLACLVLLCFICLLAGNLAFAETLPQTSQQPQAAASGVSANSNATTSALQAAGQNGWVTEADGARHWYENGIIAADKAFYDPSTDAWYWADADGSIATNKDVFIPVSNEDRSSGKWVRFDEQSRMVKGEDYRYDAWYYFDETTGEMAKGFTPLYAYPKWVFYDYVTGRMLYGEQCIDGNWYYLTPGTGAVDYEWAWIPTADKWVYYDPVTGIMYHGSHWVDGKLRYFDNVTGKVCTKDEIINKLFSVVSTTYGANLDCAGELGAAGGSVCPYGPCMSYVWWCFYHAGLGNFLCDGAITGWPHDNSNWYAARGRFDMFPQVGDIAFFRFPAQWADDMGVPTDHAGIVIGTSNDSVLVADATYEGIGLRWYDLGVCAGFAHPYYD